MKKKNRFLIILAMALILPVAMIMMMSMSGVGRITPTRSEGPCDIYTAAGNPCVAAHSSTRALYASYNGPLYQVMRQSDGKTLDIGVVQPKEGDAGGYADAAAQDAFCANTVCWITTLYDQSGKGNHLVQAPRGGFSGPAMGGFNNIPIADMAPITISGHKVYGVFIEPGMGLRWNNTKGTAVDDQAEGQYWVINGLHYNSGCCFDYGNAETDSRDDGDGTMETTYYGNATAWYHGQAPGPWIMTDQENNLVGGVNPLPNDKYLPNLPAITWRFVTATADGEPHHWRSMGGDAQNGDLKIMFDGTRIINDRSSYDPMRKQGAILLGNGGDNSNGSQGTFYEGAMTAAGTFPTKETNNKIQANIVAAKYDVQRLSLTPGNSTETPPGLQTFSPKSSQKTTLSFTNTTGTTVKDLSLSISTPRGWKSEVLNSTETSKKFSDPITPGAKVSATFMVTSGSDAFNGDLVGKASWINSNGQTQSEVIAEKVRNVSSIKINEFRITANSNENTTDAFIELFNASENAIDISNWTLTQHQTQLPIFSSIKFPAGTKVAAHGFYLLGLANSGLSVPANKGESTIYVRNVKGMTVGDAIEIDNGSSQETFKIEAIGTAAGLGEPKTPSAFGGSRPIEPGIPTTLWQPLPDGPVITIPKGSTNIPVTSVDGFEVGQKMAIGYGATYPTVAQSIEKYEVVTITKVGKPGTQAWLSADAKAGDTNIKVSSVANISAGDKIILDIDSKGHGTETVTVTRVGTQSVRNSFNGPLKSEELGTGLDLAEPLKINHSYNISFSSKGTGISFEPATVFAHSSNEPVLPLGTGIKLDKPLTKDHTIDAVVRDQKVTIAGYQGTPVPNQWFGGPALSSSAGNMVLRDAAGNVVDGLNYGGLVDPWAAEGYQATSGAGESGCFAPSPIASRGYRMAPTTSTSQPNRSSGRYPDGADSDYNCRDFVLQSALTLSTTSTVGANNIKINSVAGFNVDQKIIIESGANSETAVIKTIGTTGGTTVGNATKSGTKTFSVASVEGFSAGQIITIDNGTNLETAVVASVTIGRRRFDNPGTNPIDSISLSVPLTIAHAVGAQVSGSGITLSAPLTKAHNVGSQVANYLPTPGAPNQYIKKP
jgi:non-reducing end alpha-L-arabinofuranosidase